MFFKNNSLFIIYEEIDLVLQWIMAVRANSKTQNSEFLVLLRAYPKSKVIVDFNSGAQCSQHQPQPGAIILDNMAT